MFTVRGRGSKVRRFHWICAFAPDRGGTSIMVGAQTSESKLTTLPNLGINASGTLFDCLRSNLILTYFQLPQEWHKLHKRASVQSV